MKTTKLRVLLATATVLAAHTAFADTPGADWMPKGKAIQKLSQQGYANAYLKADDGHWEGEATKGGRIYELHVDPHSGVITKSEPKH
ncbi:PepSY domain-containing protein [Caballeronia sp. LZ034LL]|uniref:PepSY domain-containing protein n=1 Tax=Caballeronia sp. LZ034LL TaxID=3038567 RepID=UPI00286665F0|nr:PepSY domain-containing protein [Caballeronia sp. LZ034LL]MDR5839215.1 PepSY domain-containing protein [Caballeronia sp. LZ034LL]